MLIGQGPAWRPFYNRPAGFESCRSIGNNFVKAKAVICVSAAVLDNFYAVPLNYPISYGNPAPWEIIEGKVELKNDLAGNKKAVLYIRGKESMWFASDKCYLTKNLDDAKEFIIIEESKILMKKLYYSYIV